MISLVKYLSIHLYMQRKRSRTKPIIIGFSREAELQGGNFYFLLYIVLIFFLQTCLTFKFQKRKKFKGDGDYYNNPDKKTI